MNQIHKIHQHLEKSLSRVNAVKSVVIFRDRLVVVHIQTNQLEIGLDITEDSEIYMVFRSNRSHELVADHINRKIDKRIRIVPQSDDIEEFIEIVPANTVLQNVIAIVEKIIAIERDSFRYLLDSVRHLEGIIRQEQFQNNRELCRDMAEFFRDRSLGIPQTLNAIRTDRRSIARYGDGEIKSMATATGCRFQQHDWKLMQELRDIAATKSDLIVCLPSLMSEDHFWQGFWPLFWPACSFYFKQDVYGDSMVTRPEAFLFYGQQTASQWMDVWRDLNICFVTGTGSRLNGDHVLFSTAKDFDYVYSKNVDAYEEIDTTLEKCMDLKKPDIYLIALGPAGTALASRLQKEGKWALDIGHLNNSYDMVFHNSPKPEKLIR